MQQRKAEHQAQELGTHPLLGTSHCSIRTPEVFAEFVRRGRRSGEDTVHLRSRCRWRATLRPWPRERRASPLSQTWNGRTDAIKKTGEIRINLAKSIASTAGEIHCTQLPFCSRPIVFPPCPLRL